MNKFKTCLIPFLICFSGTTLKAQVEATQDFQWARNLGGTDLDEAFSIAVDASGNVFTTGTFRQTADFDPGVGTANLVSAGDDDIFISKLDADGNYVWAKRIGSSGSEGASAVTVDNSGNVYITGDFIWTVDFDPGPGIFNLEPALISDLFICKLDGDGNFLWAKNMAGTGVQGINSVAVDDSGNVYTTGYFNETFDFDPGPGIYNLVSFPGSVTAGDIFISKLDVFGNFLWAKKLGGTANDIGHDIAVDGAGNVYTTGFFRGTADFDPGDNAFNLVAGGNDVFVSKLDAFGNFVWAGSMGGTEGGDIGYSIALDGSENVYTTGHYSGVGDFDPGAGVFTLPQLGNSAFVSKLDASGNFLWASPIGFSSGVVESLAIAVDLDGNSYTTGNFSGRVDFDPGEDVFDLEDTNVDMYIRKLDPLGNFGWVKSIAASVTGYSVAVDESENVYATGYFVDSGDFDPSAGISNLVSNGSRDPVILKFGKPEVTSPTVTGFSPESGNAGTLVTITGTNFNTTAANNVVKFNGKEAEIVTVSATTITALVPFAATTGKISVTTSGGTAQSGMDFTVDAGFTVVSGLVKDIFSGPENSTTFFPEIIPFGDHVYFSVNSVIPGQFELWRSDGTSEGTTMVSDNYYSEWMWDDNISTVATENYIYFAEGNPRMLVAMDKDLNRIVLAEQPPSNWTYTSGVFKDKFLFSAGVNLTLHVFDEATRAIQELEGGIEAIAISRDSHYAYVYSIAGAKNQLFRTDGTNDGTVLVHPGRISVQNFATAGDDDYFSGEELEGTGETNLFRTNGTPESTVKLPGFDGFFGISGDLNGTLLISADVEGTEDIGYELYAVEENSIRLVKDIKEGTLGSMDHNFNEEDEAVVLDNVLYFDAYSQEGDGLWRSDGTEAGTYLVKASGSADYLELAGDKIYFSGGNQRNLWVTDGTASGTMEVPFPADGIAEITFHKGNLYFVAETIETGYELYVYNTADASLPPPCDISKPTISTSGSTLVSSSPADNQWLLNGAVITGATEPTYNVSESGNYSVEVTIETCTALSDPITMTIDDPITTGVEEHEKFIKVYPNPVSSIVRIECESIQTHGTVEIYNIMGVKKDRFLLQHQDGRLQLEIDVNQYPSGVYILNVKTEKGIQRHRIEKL